MPPARVSARSGLGRPRRVSLGDRYIQQAVLFLHGTKQAGKPTLLVVPVPRPDSRAALQGVSVVAGPAEDPVGGGAQGYSEVERPLEDPGPLVRRVVLPLAAGCTYFYGGTLVWEEDTVPEVSGSERREWEVEQRPVAETTDTGWELPLFLPTPDFMASVGKE